MNNIETERKFIIEKPSKDILKSLDNFTESEIIQIYIEDSSGTHRVRKRTYLSGITEYTENTKIRVNKFSSKEYEDFITEERFFDLSSRIEKGAHPLSKIRRTFAFSKKIFEIDIYPEWERTCIMEVELESEHETVDFPPFIKIIREVTGEKIYSNHSMAHDMPKEDII